ncbi:hypothetical protein Hanom_Chr10g00898671 [Helianthus anomalus]
MYGPLFLIISIYVQKPRQQSRNPDTKYLQRKQLSHLDSLS